MIKDFQKIRDARLSTVLDGLLRMRSPFDGEIKSLAVWTGAALGENSAILNLSINGSDVWSGSARLILGAGASFGEKSNLSLEVSKGDLIEVNVEQINASGIAGAIEINLQIDDLVAVASVVAEQVQDIVAAMMVSGTNSSWIYDDTLGTLKVDAPQLSDEQVQDKVAAMLEQGSNVTLTYDDAGTGKVTISSTDTSRTNEEIMDVVAALLQAGSNVSLTYNDGSDTLTIASSGGGGYSLPSQTGNGGKVLGTNGTSDSWVSLPFEMGVAASDETTNITTGTAKVTVRAPFAFTLVSVKSSLSTASTSGLPTVNIKKNGTTIFSTNLSIDANEKTSVTAVTAYVFTGGINPTFAADDEITIDVTVAGTGAKGLKVWFIGTR